MVKMTNLDVLNRRVYRVKRYSPMKV